MNVGKIINFKLQHRTINYIAQVKDTFLFKFFGIICSYLSFPFLLKNLGDNLYGVYSTLLSVLSWVYLFDLGIGNGLRYKIGEYLAKENIDTVKALINTAYGYIGLIAFLIFSFSSLVVFFIPLQRIFNTDLVSQKTLFISTVTVIFFISLNFFLGLINQIVEAFQKSGLVALGQFINNFLLLVFIFILYRFKINNFEYIVLVYGCSLTISNLFLYYLFFKKNILLFPKITLNRRYFSLLFSFSIKLFFIQLAVIIIYMTDKIIITQLLGPEFVTQYDIVYKLYSVVIFFWSLVTGPLSSAYTDAYHRNDLGWIRRILTVQIKMLIYCFAFIILSIFFINKLISFWLMKDIVLSLSLPFSMALYTIIYCWNINYAYILNATGMVNIQLFIAIFSVISNLPFAIFFIKFFNMKAEGVIFANILSVLPFSLIAPVLVFKILNKKGDICLNS